MVREITERKRYLKKKVNSRIVIGISFFRSQKSIEHYFKMVLNQNVANTTFELLDCYSQAMKVDRVGKTIKRTSITKNIEG